MVPRLLMWITVAASNPLGQIAVREAALSAGCTRSLAAG
jgi:hypothetical protein